MPTNTKPTHTFVVTYEPLFVANPDKPADLASFKPAGYTNEVLIEADSAAEAKRTFLAGNNGRVVSVVKVVEIKNPSKMWSPTGPDCETKKPKHTPEMAELIEAADRALAHLESYSMRQYTDTMTHTSKHNFSTDVARLRAAIAKASGEGQ
jgi:hypothetical protein